MITDAAVIAISESVARVADAVRERDALLGKMMISGDGELVAMAKNELRRRDENADFFFQLGAPLRALADAISEASE